MQNLATAPQGLQKVTRTFTTTNPQGERVVVSAEVTLCPPAAVACDFNGFGMDCTTGVLAIPGREPDPRIWDYVLRG